MVLHTASSFERHLNNLDDPLHGIAEQEATLRSLNRCAKAMSGHALAPVVHHDKLHAVNDDCLSVPNIRRSMDRCAAALYKHSPSFHQVAPPPAPRS